MPVNFECKARCSDLESAQKTLLTYQPRYIGEDHQVDTYFHVPNGRLKLREGRIENALIHYEREDKAGAKQSNVILYQHQPDPSLKNLLSKSLGIKVVVDKKRKIYFIDNVKFHFDQVEGLGTFVEIEAIDADDSTGMERLQQQCAFYAGVLRIEPGDYQALSYSDMILSQSSFQDRQTQTGMT